MMTEQKLLQRLIPISIILISISSIVGYVQLKTGLPVANTTIWWLIQALVLLLFLLGKKKFFDSRQSAAFIVVFYYILWNVFSCLRGVFIAETYWDWKGLTSNTMALLIPIMSYVGTNTIMLQAILRYYIKYGLPLFGLFIFLIAKDAYGFYLVPVSFLLVFLPALRWRWKLALLACAIFVVSADLDARSNVIKFSLPIVFSLLFYFKFFLKKTLLEWTRKLLFIAPVVLFSLAVNDVFNIFNMDEYIGGDITTKGADSYGEVVEKNLKADTRTFLYRDVLHTADKYDSWWIGRSPVRGNESEAFGMADESGRGERLGNEVAILNIFMWTGLIGVILHFLVFYRASYLAVNRSNNFYSKILGLFMAFRWLYAWVEDINYFTLTTVFLWLMLGLCFSRSFRAMTDSEVKYWIQGVFYKRYSFTSNQVCNASVSAK